MKKFLLTFILFASLSVSAQKKWSLDACLEQALFQNEQVLQQKLAIQLQEQNIKASQYGRLPNFNLNAIQGYYLGSSYNISTGVGQLESSYTSFDLSSSLDLIKIFAKHETQVERFRKNKEDLELEIIKKLVSIQVTQLYFEILYNTALLEVLKEQVELSQNELDRVGNLYRSALKSELDLNTMKTVLAIDQKEQFSVQKRIANNLLELQKLLGLEKEDFEIETVGINLQDFSIRDLTSINKKIRNHPFLEAIRVEEDIHGKEISLIKRNFYPSLRLNYSFGSNYFHILGRPDLVYNEDTQRMESNGFFHQMRNNRTHAIFLQLTIPVFNRYSYRSELNKLKLNIASQKIKLENKERELRHDIGIVLNDIDAAAISKETLELASHEAEENLELAVEKFHQGLIPINTMLELKRNLLIVQSEYLKAKYDYAFKMRYLNLLL